MNTVINAKELRSGLPQVVQKVRRGMRFTVLYRSRPAFQVIPVDVSEFPIGEVAEDPLYRAKPVGRSVDGRSAADHDALLYGR
jgi:antitoxin (DNA-binding transcriptional repressor) of toxin-antitoxin stability system